MPDFAQDRPSEIWYDLREDWALIEASFAKQYGIRLRQEGKMPWSEFCSLVSGLMSDTPLGQVVAIRAEKDKKVIKDFTPDQKRIHNEWRQRRAKQLTEDSNKLDERMDSLTKLLESMFGKGG